MDAVGLLGAMLTILFDFPWGGGGNNEVLENINQKEAQELPLSPENLGEWQRILGVEC